MSKTDWPLALLTTWSWSVIVIQHLVYLCIEHKVTTIDGSTNHTHECDILQICDKQHLEIPVLSTYMYFTLPCTGIPQSFGVMKVVYRQDSECKWRSRRNWVEMLAYAILVYEFILWYNLFCGMPEAIVTHKPILAFKNPY